MTKMDREIAELKAFQKTIFKKLDNIDKKLDVHSETIVKQGRSMLEVSKSLNTCQKGREACQNTVKNKTLAAIGGFVIGAVMFFQFLYAIIKDLIIR